MLLPVRCFTCNKVLGHLGDTLSKWKQEHDYQCNDPDASLEPFFDTHRIERYCCRKILLTFHDESDPLVTSNSKYDMPPTIQIQTTVQHPRLYIAR